MAEKRGKREKVVNPATGRMVYADGPTGRCVKALEAQARRLGGKASPPKKAASQPKKAAPIAPKKGILKAPKTSEERAMLRTRWISRLENAPKTVANERLFEKTRGNRNSKYATPTQAVLDGVTQYMVNVGDDEGRWKMAAGNATRRAKEMHTKSKSSLEKRDKNSPEWKKGEWRKRELREGENKNKKWTDSNAKAPTKIKWYEKSGPVPLVADGWEVQKDAPVKGVRTLQGGKARSKESAERRRVEGGRREGKSKNRESLQHEFDRFSPGEIWYPKPLGEKAPEYPVAAMARKHGERREAEKRAQKLKNGKNTPTPKQPSPVRTRFSTRNSKTLRTGTFY